MLTAVSHSLVAVYIWLLGPHCDTSYFWLAADSEFCCMKPTISTICHRLYNRYSLTLCHTLLNFVVLLTLRVRKRPSSCWSALSFHGLPTSYWLIRRKEISGSPVHLHVATALARCWWPHIHLSLYLFQTGWHSAENVEQLHIELCNIWEPLAEIRGNLSQFVKKGCQVIRDAEFMVEQLAQYIVIWTSALIYMCHLPIPVI